VPNFRERKRKPLKSHPAGHAPRFGTRASVVQPSQPLAVLDMGDTAAEQRDFLAATDNDLSDDSYDAVNFRQTGRRESRLPYDTKDR
jgi:hypothetical protein